MLLGEITENIKPVYAWDIIVYAEPATAKNAYTDAIFSWNIGDFFFGIQDFKTVKCHFFIYYNEIIKSGENKICFLYNRSMTAVIPEFIKELT